MWNLFCYLDLRRHFLGNTGLKSAPCSRFILSFFRSKAIARRNSSARILARPRVRNLRKPKSFSSRAKAQMNPPGRGNAPGGFPACLPKSLLETQRFGLLRVLGLAALAAAGAAGTALTPVPGDTPDSQGGKAANSCAVNSACAEVLPAAKRLYGALTPPDRRPVAAILSAHCRKSEILILASSSKCPVTILAA